jgi:hypothetical protein
VSAYSFEGLKDPGFNALETANVGVQDEKLKRSHLWLLFLL